MRELSGEERQIGNFKKKFRESDNPEMQLFFNGFPGSGIHKYTTYCE